MTAAVWAFIRALPIWGQLVGVVVALAIIAGGYGLWHHKVYREGYDKAIADVAAQDKEAIDARDRAVNRINQCRNSGGVWRQASGQCERR